MFLESKNEYDAFSFIYNFYVNDLLSYGVSLGFDEDTCRDAVHDIFCKILVDKKKLLNVNNLTSYLFRAVRNYLFNIQKKNCKISDSFWKYTFFHWSNNIESLINARYRKTKTNRWKPIEWVDPVKEKYLFEVYAEMDYDEIALLMNINYNSARRLVYRSIDHLRSINKDPENPC